MEWNLPPKSQDPSRRVRTTRLDWWKPAFSLFALSIVGHVTAAFMRLPFVVFWGFAVGSVPAYWVVYRRERSHPAAWWTGLTALIGAVFAVTVLAQHA